MIYCVESIQIVNYKSKKTGKDVDALNLVLTCDDESGTWSNGKAYKIVFVNRECLDAEICEGDFVKVHYNEYRSVSEVVHAE